jgi:hypothetical protein
LAAHRNARLRGYTNYLIRHFWLNRTRHEINRKLSFLSDSVLILPEPDLLIFARRALTFAARKTAADFSSGVKELIFPSRLQRAQSINKQGAWTLVLAFTSELTRSTFQCP